MFFKDSTTLLAEVAASDLDMEVSTSINEAHVLNIYEQIEELEEEVHYAPEFVPVINIKGEFYTEMQYLAPYMQNNGITSIEAALVSVAEANKLDPHAVGLVIESQDSVSAKIAEACKKSKKAGSNMMAKIGKIEDISKKLSDKGFKIKKKKSVKESGNKEKCCKECGKPMSKCECGVKKESANPFADIFTEADKPEKLAKKICPTCGRPQGECKCGPKNEDANVEPHQQEPGSETPKTESVEDFFNF